MSQHTHGSSFTDGVRNARLPMEPHTSWGQRLGVAYV